MIKRIKDIYRKKGAELLEFMLSEAKACFSLADAQKKLGLPKNHVVKILSTLKQNKKILALSKGFYAYFPPTEKKFGFNVIKVLDQIMKYKKIPYYVGLLSAADYYGAAHYKPQVLQVMIPKQVSFRKARDLGISFHIQKYFPKNGLTQIKMPYGYVSYPTPELLVLDLIQYEQASGGIENVALVIKEIMHHVNNKNLQTIAMEYPVIASIQRLGYIFEKIGSAKPLSGGLQAVMNKRGASVVKLSSVLPKKGKFEPKWKIIQNTSLEIDDDI